MLFSIPLLGNRWRDDVTQSEVGPWRFYEDMQHPVTTKEGFFRGTRSRRQPVGCVCICVCITVTATSEPCRTSQSTGF